MYLKEYINELHLDCGQSARVDCPVCKGKNTFTTTNMDGVIVYNCYKAGCYAKGSVKTQLSVEQVMSTFKQTRSEHRPTSDFVLPSYITPSPSVGSFADYWKIPDTDLLLDVKDNRAVFPIHFNNKLVDAVGRTLGKSTMKWKRYANSSALFTSGYGKTAVVVEDAISASVVPTINTSLTGVALMGTNMRDEFIDQLRRYDKIAIALDPDARDKTIKITKKLTSAGFNTTALNLTDDLKYRRQKDVEYILRLAKRDVALDLQ